MSAHPPEIVAQAIRYLSNKYGRSYGLLPPEKRAELVDVVCREIVAGTIKTGRRKRR